MALKISKKLTAVLLGLVLLTGCQHQRMKHVSTQADMAKPAMTEVQRSVAAANTQATQQAAKQQSINVHLAQKKAEPTLQEVDLGNNGKLYALEQPILTQEDMQQVTPITAQNGQTFIMFDMNQQGANKLANTSSQAQGHYFLLTVQGQLVSVAQIAGPMTDGKLLISTRNAEHSAEIINLLR